MEKTYPIQLNNITFKTLPVQNAQLKSLVITNKIFLKISIRCTYEGSADKKAPLLCRMRSFFFFFLSKQTQWKRTNLVQKRNSLPLVFKSHFNWPRVGCYGGKKSRNPWRGDIALWWNVTSERLRNSILLSEYFNWLVLGEILRFFFELLFITNILISISFMVYIYFYCINS